MKAVIVIPTYNEIDNIGRLIDALEVQISKISYAEIDILVVDDQSPDGTARLVLNYALKYPNVHLVQGAGKAGLGVAYVLGFTYAIKELEADVVFEMDADFSHDPEDIRRLLGKINEGYDFVIGSRYVPGGSIPANWGKLRVANSKWGNIFARRVAGLGNVHDCTGGFRAIRTSLLKRFNLHKLGAKGYAFQINLLHSAIKHGARVAEVPITFKDREFGESKLQLKDITEFVSNCFNLRFPLLKYLLSLKLYLIITLLITIPYIILLSYHALSFYGLTVLFIVTFSLLMTIQCIFNLFLMIYAWEDADRVEKNKSPERFYPAKHSFTAIVPARHEDKVIEQTIRAISNIQYPEYLKEVLVVCRTDDKETIAAVNEAITYIGKANIKLILFDDYPINKPHSLNIALRQATKEIVTVFDAEDQPHHEIYNIINTVMIRDGVEVVQSGVQLMNFRSNWFSAFNVLEYYFWFKSMLHFFARMGLVPLGGNTVFIKRQLLKHIGGWDELCLTEDADLGLRLSANGTKIQVVYDELHATREETPDSTMSFIKQRTRWNQGFLQILLKNEWKTLPMRQKLLALYILLLPEVQGFFFIVIPFSLLIAFTLKLPVYIALLSIFPILILGMQFVVYNIGLYEFTRSYNYKYPLFFSLNLLVTMIPFQLLLGYSALRAIVRMVNKDEDWEKTAHINAHRESYAITPAIN